MQWLRNIWLRSKSQERIFNDFYRRKLWGSHETRSGVGSTLEMTVEIRKELPILLEKYGIKTLLDAPCGDFFWMKETLLPIEKYIGGDIVAEMIAENNRLYGQENREFRSLHLLKSELPVADMLLCRDCLVHFSFEDIFSALSNIQKSPITYLLMTHFPEMKENTDILTGRWRALNFEKAPFYFPPPIALIQEKIAKGKTLALWKIDR